MKILLDECVTKRLKPHIKEHLVLTVTEMNWSGLKNGRLLAQCEDEGFDVLLTIDKNLMFQQNLKEYNVTIVVLNSSSSKVEELVQFLPSFEKQAPTFEKRKAYLLNK